MIKKSELVVREEANTMYHLGISPEHLSDTILLVGDPGRVPIVSNFFNTVEYQHQNRELVYHLGTYKGKRIAVLSTGMGVDNIDIVVTELDALANLNLKTGKPLTSHRTLQLIRIGTCGILQPDIPLLSFIASEYALGLDGMIYYYKTEKACLKKDMEEQFVKQMNWSSLLPKPYITTCSKKLLNKLNNNYIHGITATAPGFYGPQGRTIRAELLDPDFPKKLQNINIDGNRIVNLEMESSCLFALANILGHEALTICVGIAKRVTGEFSSDYQKPMQELIYAVLNDII